MTIKLVFVMLFVGCILQAQEIARVVGVFGSSGPFSCENVTIRIGAQDFVLVVKCYVPHHFVTHGFTRISGKCLTHVKLGDELRVQGPIAEGKNGKTGPVSADDRYMYFKVTNPQGKICDAAVLG